MATRGRKPAKRVSVEIQLDMSAADYQQFKANIKSLIQSNFNGELVYLAIGADNKE